MNIIKDFSVVKASGVREKFSIEKFKNSLRKSDLSEEEIDNILTKLQKDLYDGISTQELYRKTSQLLRNSKHVAASKYNLKHAIMMLGPSGYLFEKFVAEIFKAKGYSTSIDQTVMGHCVSHEIDIIADNDKKSLMIECKFHNLPGIKTNVKIPLYVKARYEDVTHGYNEKKCTIKFQEYWLVTNTRFTTDAIQYGNCVGMHLLAWGYPEKSLEKIIEKHKIYPITCLFPLLNAQEIAQFIKNGLILCKNILKNPTFLNQFRFNEDKIQQIFHECQHLSE